MNALLQITEADTGEAFLSLFEKILEFPLCSYGIRMYHNKLRAVEGASPYKKAEYTGRGRSLDVP